MVERGLVDAAEGFPVQRFRQIDAGNPRAELGGEGFDFQAHGLFRLSKNPG